MIYDWKEERNGNLECHLRISVSCRPLELWGGFGNHLEFSEINAQLFVSRVCVKSVTQKKRQRHFFWMVSSVNSFGSLLILLLHRSDTQIHTHSFSGPKFSCDEHSIIQIVYSMGAVA